MNSIRTHIHTFACQEKNLFIIAQTVVVFKNIRVVTLCLHTHRLNVNRFQAMRRPTGFIKDSSYVALDVDMWCPDVVVVEVVRARVCVGGSLVGGGGDVCVSRDTFELK